MKKLVIISVALFFSGISLGAFEVPVAEFQVTYQTDQRDLVNASSFGKNVFDSLIVQDFKGLIGFKFEDTGVTAGLIKSQLDAVKNCEIHGWELIVYGEISVSDKSCDVEIKIYNHSVRQVVKTFLLRSSIADYKELIDDTGKKIYQYFVDQLKIDSAQNHALTESNALTTSHVIDYWGVIEPWSVITTTIIGYHGVFAGRLGSPIWTNGEWMWLQEIGVGIGFQYADNKSGYVSFNQFDIDFGLYAAWAFVWQRQQEIRVSIEPGAKFHLLDYMPLYASENLLFTTWYGLAVNAEYRIWLDSQRIFGLGLNVGGAIYLVDPLYIDFKIGIDFAWKWKI